MLLHKLKILHILLLVTNELLSPKKYRFPGDKVLIKRVGNAVVLLPYQNSWEALFESLEQFSADFMIDREQPEQQKR
ncbi:MAG: antitoxin, partial [Xenococcaceae cyanobacterium]